MIKILNFGFHSPDSSLNIIQRNGKKIVLALTISIGTTSEKFGELDATTPVTFGIEEVPLKAVAKLLLENQHMDGGALVAIENGKPLAPEATEALKDFVGRSVGTVSVSELTRQL